MRDALTVGVLGGLGPEATVDFMARVLALTPARCDQDHLHLLVDCDPRVPNRNEALAGTGPSPVPALTAMARRLEAAGADFLVIACNTAHAFLPALRPAVRIPFLGMIEATVDSLRRSAPGASRAGLLAADGCRRARLYEPALEHAGILPVQLDAAAQARLMALIYAIKAGDRGGGVREEAMALARRLVADGAQAIVAACTELPLVLQAGDVPCPFVDSTAALAEATVAVALGRRPLPSAG
ncbi:MAG: amino acid racemase [Geminicoccaceae bacterium]